ncbi:MAG: hypothetical protein ACJA01_001855 [Saprospiraceae bacterium]|jgi:hypothetical protein
MKKNSYLEIAKAFIAKQNAWIGKEESFFDEIVERSVTRIQRDLSGLESILEQSNRSLIEARQDIVGLSIDIAKMHSFST